MSFSHRYRNKTMAAKKKISGSKTAEKEAGE